ncbi:hypothetical protein FPV67DRAFT_1668013 [Lyophyllum atratum]|nr:hypothetical protein FPV67DRAFT_1668013 [Lyophyllum atratum]
MVATLPTELIEAIVGHIPGHDTATLKACALVSRAFLPPSRSRWLSVVQLNSQNANSFHELLSSPLCTIPSRIERLRFGHPSFRFSSTSVQKFPAILAAFSSIEILSISSYFKESLPLPPPYSPHLKIIHLELIGIQFQTAAQAVSFVCSFPSLRTLQLVGVTWKSSSVQIPPDIRLPPKLDALRLMGGCNEFLLWMLRLHDISTTNLQLISSMTFDGVSAEETPAIENLINALAGSLRYLAIYFKPKNSSSEIALCNHPSLAYIPTVRIMALTQRAIVKTPLVRS